MKEKLRNGFLLAALALMVGFLPGITVKAGYEEGYDYQYGDYGYVILDDRTVSITKYLGAGGDVIIPSELGGRIVSEIGEYPRASTGAFEECQTITSVVIPGTVKRIEEAFTGCTNLKKVTMECGVETIERGFEYCSSLTDITLPGEVEINPGTFSATGNIKTITIAEGSQNVNHSIKYILYPSLYGADSSYDSLTTINIPDSVITMEDNIFQRCTALTTVNLSNNLTNIGEWQFAYCELLKSISLPDTLTKIEVSAFGSTGLTEITIPDSVTSIENSAFHECLQLSSVTFGNGIRSIGVEAFYGCSMLKSVTIPKNVTSIERGAFGYFFYGTSDVEEYGAFTIYGYTGSAAQDYAAETKIPFVALDSDSVQGNSGTQSGSGSSTQKTPGGGTGNSGFSYTGDVRRTAGSGASRATYTTTGPDTAEYSFPAVASNVTEIVIPDTVIINGRRYKVTYVGSNAFAGNTTITKVSIGNNVQTIRSGAFAGCTNLKKITGGKSLTYIYERAFENCAKLKKVNLTSKSLIYIRNYAFRKCTSLKSFTSKSKKLTSIGEQAFAGDKKLKKIILSTKKLKKANVGKKAFKGIAKKCVFKVPAKKAGAYKKIFKARGAKKAIVK